jgi:8-oxo-dGTP pyrophosphatase MutT (NUDIX family)
MIKTVQVVMINKDGEVLAVSRKDDHTDFGLPGGKIEPQDLSIKMGAIREVKEETGLLAFNLELIFAMHRNGKMGYTYLADFEGEINTEEPHVVKWSNYQEIINGRFGEWNKLVYKTLLSKGIKVKL